MKREWRPGRMSGSATMAWVPFSALLLLIPAASPATVDRWPCSGSEGGDGGLLAPAQLSRLAVFRNMSASPHAAASVFYRKNSKASSTSIGGWLNQWLRRWSGSASGGGGVGAPPASWALHTQEARGLDPRCLDRFERDGMLLVTTLRAPLNRTVSQFHYTATARRAASPSSQSGGRVPNAAAGGGEDPAVAWRHWLAAAASARSPPRELSLSKYVDNYYVRAFTARCDDALFGTTGAADGAADANALRECLSGCPLRPVAAGGLGPADLAAAVAALERFDVVLFTEVTAFSPRERLFNEGTTRESRGGGCDGGDGRGGLRCRWLRSGSQLRSPRSPQFAPLSGPGSGPRGRAGASSLLWERRSARGRREPPRTETARHAGGASRAAAR